ncbi:hypothetical protein J2X68_007260 [Streptomyces sp. 3330]|uniref:hypothetical protein n=1 Tax=Streptomyces sp. 3330 TaxID=2817755 RepID=UPI0028582209|nr:hypothetical protein [Streptomyces sp. 3330]MDR6980520.1 hypothetical protein [Streptomyces sp. 3330]
MSRSRARTGWGVVGGVLFLVTLLAVLLSAMGLWRWFVRVTAPALVDLPGGGWTAGALLGLLSVAGWAGGAWCSSPDRDRTQGRTQGPGRDRSRSQGQARDEAQGPQRGRSGGARAGLLAGGAVCWTVAFGAPMYVLGALPGRNCRSGGAMCAYLPGTGSALLAYAATAALLGFLRYRRRGAVTAARRAEERARMRRLRKKGKGRSRAARSS